jgi:Flp pilus assembly protein TadD
MVSGRPQRAIWGAVLLLVALAGLWGTWLWHRPAPTAAVVAPVAPPADPRLLYAGPFLNIHPDVAFVGDAKCAECHLDKALTYQDHPMARSLLPISAVAARQRYDAAVNNPFHPPLSSQDLFLVERHGDRVLHRWAHRNEKHETIYALDQTADYVIGSGARGHSYLSNRGGFLFQTPISWFSQKQIWDLSPGIAAEHRTGRPVLAMCLFCHANRARPREGTINGYEEPIFDGHSIGCERCHGPGGRHVLSAVAHEGPDRVDLTIVNPRHLEPKLRAAVCEQCHLAGEVRVLRRGRGLYDFRPGLPLEEFIAIFVRLADTRGLRKAVNHVEQLYLSQCFLRSVERPAEGKRKLGCTSCHDPHRHIGPAERGPYYRARCLACHAEQGKEAQARPCSVPEPIRRGRQADDSCFACHMPRYTAADIAHNATTDHRIPRRPDSASAAATPRVPLEPGLVSFYPEEATGADQRNLGIALAHLLLQRVRQTGTAPGPVGSETISLLEGALRNDPDDLPAWRAKAQALALLDRRTEALAAYETSLSQEEESEVALQGAAMLAEQLGRTEVATTYWRRAVAVDPWQPAYRASLAQLLVRQGAWAEAGPHLEAWLRLDPSNVEARMLLARYWLRCGDRARARAELATIEQLAPPNLEHFRARFEVEARSRR